MFTGLGIDFVMDLNSNPPSIIRNPATEEIAVLWTLVELTRFNDCISNDTISRDHTFPLYVLSNTQII